MTTFAFGTADRSRFTVSRESLASSSTSRRITSGLSLRACRSASSAVEASPQTRIPESLKTLCRPCLMMSWSSTTRTLTAMGGIVVSIGGSVKDEVPRNGLRRIRSIVVWPLAAAVAGPEPWFHG